MEGPFFSMSYQEQEVKIDESLVFRYNPPSCAVEGTHHGTQRKFAKQVESKVMQ
jgi:hypothetical protein